MSSRPAPPSGTAASRRRGGICTHGRRSPARSISPFDLVSILQVTWGRHRAAHLSRHKIVVRRLRQCERIIALDHGATIDKYVGDSIIAFFGDPETRGVKEDARTCVKMAIAMQRRMRELRTEWLEMGLEQPFELRIGINTGFCTVGNFGSADLVYQMIRTNTEMVSITWHQRHSLTGEPAVRRASSSRRTSRERPNRAEKPNMATSYHRPSQPPNARPP